MGRNGMRVVIVGCERSCMAREGSALRAGRESARGNAQRRHGRAVNFRPSYCSPSQGPIPHNRYRTKTSSSSTPGVHFDR